MKWEILTIKLTRPPILTHMPTVKSWCIGVIMGSTSSHVRWDNCDVISYSTGWKGSGKLNQHPWDFTAFTIHNIFINMQKSLHYSLVYNHGSKPSTNRHLSALVIYPDRYGCAWPYILLFVAIFPSSRTKSIVLMTTGTHQDHDVKYKNYKLFGYGAVKWSLLPI